MTAPKGMKTGIRSKDLYDWPHNISFHSVIRHEIESNLTLNVH